MGERRMDMEEIKRILMQWGYLPVSNLGSGSQGMVLLVQQVHTGEYLACKISSRPQLDREGWLLRQLAHPGFPRFMNAWKQAGYGFLVMEYIQGCTLEQRLHSGPVTLEEAMKWGRELGEALCHLHDMAEGWIFRDMKPANILVRRDGHIKLIDLGCACSRQRVADTKAGSYRYGAPEQFLAPQQVNEKSDIYAWGKVMEEILRYCEIKGIRQRFLCEKVKRLIRKCIVSDRSRRIESMRGVLSLLEMH